MIKIKGTEEDITWLNIVIDDSRFFPNTCYIKSSKTKFKGTLLNDGLWELEIAAKNRGIKRMGNQTEESN